MRGRCQPLLAHQSMVSMWSAGYAPNCKEELENWGRGGRVGRSFIYRSDALKVEEVVDRLGWSW